MSEQRPAEDSAPLRAGIAALEAQRALLGDAVVELALAPLRERLATMQGAPAQLLRQVSILFLDVVGSTQLSGRLDPEDLHQLLDGALQRFTASVQQQGGRVLQYAGDSLLAVWGAEGVREDDAQRAVACGLLLLQAGAEGLPLRVGVHTGQVLLGGGVNAEGSIRGQAVNVAARMEQAAPVGGLRISHDTWLLVRGAFEAQPQPPLLVKGLDEPVRTYLVQRARARAELEHEAEHGSEGRHAPLVGRQAELAQLLHALDAATASGRLRAVSVMADAGLGKSRLLAALRQALQARGHTGAVLLARAQPSSAGRPYTLLRELLASRLQFGEDEAPAALRERLLRSLTPLFEGDPDYPEPRLPALLLGRLIGLEDGDEPALAALRGDARSLRDQAFAAGVRLLARLAAGGAALAVLLEDLHWADEASLDFLAHLLAHPPQGPVLLVMLARPALLERRPQWVESGAAAHSLLPLRPLAAEEAGELARALLHGLPELPAELRQLLTERAQGNPYYMQELVRMLLDDRVVEAAEGRPWVLHGERLRQLRLPPSLNGVLQARLDALNAAERQALQQAAVIGPVFWDEALQALSPGAPAQLPALLNKGLLLGAATSAFEGAHEYSFQHALMHQAVYATVLKAARREAHGRAAAWLRQRLGEHGGEMLPVVAEHAAQAGDTALAQALFEQAALQAKARYANATARDLAERALELAGGVAPELRWRLLEQLVVLADMMGDRERQARWCDALEAMAEQADNNAWRASVMVDRSLLADRLGQQDTALQRSQALAAFAERHGLAHHAAMGLANCAWQYLMADELVQARDHIERALVWCRQQPRRLTLSQMLLVASSIDQVEGCWSAMQSHLQEAQAAADQVPHELRLQELLHERWHVLHGRLGDAARSLHHAQAAFELVQRLGLRHHHEAATINLAQAQLQAGDAEAAMGLLRSAIERLGDAPGDEQAWSAAREALAEALQQLGRPAEAQGLLHEVLARRRREGSPWALRQALALVVGNQLALGQAAAALPLVEELLQDPEGGFQRRGATAVLWPCHRVLLALGDPRATALAERARRAARAELALAGDAPTGRLVWAGSAVLREVLGEPA